MKTIANLLMILVVVLAASCCQKQETVVEKKVEPKTQYVKLDNKVSGIHTVTHVKEGGMHYVYISSSWGTTITNVTKDSLESLTYQTFLQEAEFLRHKFIGDEYAKDE